MHGKTGKNWCPAGPEHSSSDDDDGDHIDCTGRSCRYCAAFLIADCIAIGCCPCAVVSMLALVFVKVPWAMSRKCLRWLKRRWRPNSPQKRVRMMRSDSTGRGSSTTHHDERWINGKKRSINININIERDGEAGLTSVVSGTSIISRGTLRTSGEDDEKGGRTSLCCSAFDAADKIMWVELYQIGQWGFGRLSFSGNLKDSLP